MLIHFTNKLIDMNMLKYKIKQTYTLKRKIYTISTCKKNFESEK